MDAREKFELAEKLSNRIELLKLQIANLTDNYTEVIIRVPQKQVHLNSKNMVLVDQKVMYKYVLDYSVEQLEKVEKEFAELMQ